MGRTKALIDLDGVPMARRVGDALRDAGCATVVAYGGDPHELRTLGMSVLPDRYPGTGPLGGVLGALDRFASQEPPVAGVFAVACDLPALTAPDLSLLVVSARAHPEVDVIVARTTDIEPACAIWRRSALDPVGHWFAEGERALHVVIARLSCVVVDIDASALRNINTPEDLDRYPGPRDS